MEVAEGVWQLEIPMRHNPLGKTYSYLLEDSRTLIDTGVPTDYAVRALSSQLREHSLRLEDIRRVIVTHLHNDHIGIVGLLHRHGAEIMAHRVAVERQEFMQELWKDMYGATSQELKLMGGSSFMGYLQRFQSAWEAPQPTPIDTQLSDGDTLELKGVYLRVIWTPGHANEHICLMDEERRLLFSGDHVLPKITSHISLHTYQEADPLRDYLASLDKVRGLPVDRVLPAHEHVFETLARRIDQLKAHHEARLNEIKDALRGGERTVYQVSSTVHWDSRPWPEMSFWTRRMAVAETYAHLVYLRNRSVVDESLKEEVLYYSLA